MAVEPLVVGQLVDRGHAVPEDPGAPSSSRMPCRSARGLGHGGKFAPRQAPRGHGFAVCARRQRRGLDRRLVEYLPTIDAAQAGESFDHACIFGGIHHVNDRMALFSEIHRILEPGGRLLYREPVSDFFVWQALRSVIYRLSPALDHKTERPLTYEETVPLLED